MLGRAAGLGAVTGGVIGLFGLPVGMLVAELPDLEIEDVGIAVTQFGNVVVVALFVVVGALAGAITGLASAGTWLTLRNHLGVRPWLCRLAAGLVAAAVAMLLASLTGMTRPGGAPGLAAVLAVFAGVTTLLAVPALGHRAPGPDHT